MTIAQQKSQLPANGCVKQTDSPDIANTNKLPESAVLYPRLNDQPPKAVSSEGCWITTSDGLQIFDASSGAAVACVGHNDPRVKAAVMRQLNDIAYCYAPFFTTEPAEKLAKELSESTDHQMSRAFIVSSGTCGDSKIVPDADKLIRH